MYLVTIQETEFKGGRSVPTEKYVQFFSLDEQTIKSAIETAVEKLKEQKSDF